MEFLDGFVTVSFGLRGSYFHSYFLWFLFRSCICFVYLFICFDFFLHMELQGSDRRIRFNSYFVLDVLLSWLVSFFYGYSIFFFCFTIVFWELCCEYLFSCGFIGVFLFIFAEKWKFLWFLPFARLQVLE
jgi:hypothetical protein